MASPGNVKPANIRKSSSTSSHKDIWSITREGSVAEVDAALLLLKKNGGNVDGRNAFGLTPLHIATWRNHVPIVRRLLVAGADPDARDGESGWSSLHRALHFGHLAVAGILLQFGASLILEDLKGRTPIDLISGPVAQAVGNAPDSVTTEIFSWGSGTNYQLGTGNAHIQKLPCKVESLHGMDIKVIAASKFHSIAVSSNGDLYTWGFGRGGRLGHPDFHIHSGQAAVITPLQVTSGIGSRRVKVVATAKHHVVVATDVGEVFSWGSNREGQLGYTSVDTQPIPKRVASLKVKIVAVAAANKHSAAVAESGEVYTWGSNKEGQLGYGTSNSSSNYVPRMVEYLKGKVFKGVSAAKHHTVVLGADGEVFTWGHRLVTPRRVVVARSLKKTGIVPLKFHRVGRLHVTQVAAGFVHSTALTDDGALFYWVSTDPDLRCQQLYAACGKNVTSISAGKYWTAAVTSTGDIFSWDSKKNKGEPPVLTRLHGVKRATSVCVGETHMLVLSTLYHPIYPPKPDIADDKSSSVWSNGLEELDEEFVFNDFPAGSGSASTQSNEANKVVPDLKSLCEKVAIEYLLEPRSAMQLLEIADSLEAHDLKKHCEDIALRNLDYILAVAAPSVTNASPEILAGLEKLLDLKSSEPWSHRRLPTMTATHPAVLDSDHEEEMVRLKVQGSHKPIPKMHGESTTDNFLQVDSIADQEVLKQVRVLKKKLQQIEMLEAKQLSGHRLDDQQIAKLETKDKLITTLSELGFPCEKVPTLDDRVNTKPESSKKQRRKNKQKVAQADSLSINIEQPIGAKKLQEDEEISISEEKDVQVNLKNKIQADILFNNARDIDSSFPLESNPSRLTPTPSKKKNKKAGLSLFLSGALDDAPKPTPPIAIPPTPKHEGPAWGGAKVTNGAPSLRDIQNEQSKTKGQVAAKVKDHAEELMETDGVGRVSLASFLPAKISSPIPVASARGLASSSLDAERSTPPWASSGSSPGIARPSLRDIQMQQEKRKQGISHSPTIRMSGFSIHSHGLSSDIPSTKDSTPNCWYRQESEAPSSIRSIQIEEQAAKELRRFYSSVKLVKPQPQ